MAQTILAQGARNVVTGSYVATGGGVGTSYGGAHADPTGAADSTQAFLDAMNINRSFGTGACLPVVIYVPSGTYKVNKMIIMWDLTTWFGEPSAPPTITLTNRVDSGSNPFIVTTPSTGKPAYSTDYTTRGGGGTTSTGNLFGCYIRDINFALAAGTVCSYVVLWATAQNTGFRNSVLTGSGNQTGTLGVGEAVGPGGGGQIIDNITCSGNGTAVSASNYFAIAFRNCHFNGQVQNNSVKAATFIGCTFNNPGGVGLSNNPQNNSSVEDSTFTSGTQMTASGTYHIERTTFTTANSNPSIPAGLCVQYTTGPVWYNGASINGTTPGGSLAQAGVVRTSPIPNTPYPYPSAACVNGATIGVSPNTGNDMGAAFNTALASHNEIFLPIGDYIINTTVHLGPGQKLFGGGNNWFVGASVRGLGTGYGDTNLFGSASPLISATGAGTGQGIVLTSLQVVSTGNNGAMVCNCDPSSLIFDCAISPSGGNSTTLAFGMDIQSGGLIWVCGDNANQAGPGNATNTGFFIEAHGPTYIIGVSTQEFASDVWIINGAQNLYVASVDGENGRTEFVITNSSNIYISCGDQDDGPGVFFATVANSQVSIWAVSNWLTTGAPTVMVGEGANSFGGRGPIGGYVDFTSVVISPPSVGVSGVTNITQTTATLNGSISSTNGAAITSDGFHYGTTTAYGSTAAAATVQSGAFSANITGLVASTLYDIQVFAVNSAGTGTATGQFTTLGSPVAPTVIASGATVGSGVATLNGSISSTGGSAITADGFDWGPTIAYGTHIAATTVQSGSFSSAQLTGLANGTTYHYRATAVNAIGSSVSSDSPFTPSLPPPFVQGAITVGGTSAAVTTLSLSFNNPQAAGNTNVISVCFHSTTVTASVTDSHGQTYGIASPLTSSPGGDSQVIFWSTAIAAGGNTVTLTLTGAGAQFVGLRIAEYSGIGSTDVHSQQGGTGATASVPAFTTTNASDIIVAAVVNDATSIQSFASGFIEELSGASLGFGGIDFQDSKPGAIVTNATVPTVLAASANWVENVATFSPTVTTGIPTVGVSAATVGSTTATLNGSITSNGNQTITGDGFDWGTTTTYGAHVTATTVQSGAFSFNLTGLTNGATYHYRSTADNASGTGVSGDSQFTPAGTVTPPALVQHAYSDPQTAGNTVSAIYASAQIIGDLNVVAIGWADAASTIFGVADTKGNVYTIAGGPGPTRGVGMSQSIYYCANIVAALAGANTVTVTFSGGVSVNFADLRISEFSGTAITSPVDVTSSTIGTAAAVSSATVTTANANDIIYGAAYTDGGISLPGTSPVTFSLLDITAPDQNIHEYAIVSTTGPYAATCSEGGTSNWVCQMVAFKAGLSGPVIPTVTVSSASVGSGTAALNGSISSNGGGAITADGFDWGTSTTYGTHVAATTVQSGAFSFGLSGLTNGTTYHYRATAANSAGTGVSGDSQFIPSGTVSVPTLVQHVATASNNQHADGSLGTITDVHPGNPFFLNLPNPALAGNCLILEASGRTLTQPTVTDNASPANTWTPVNSATDGTAKTWVFVALNVTAGTQFITINFGSNIWNGHFKCSEFNNVVSVDGSASSHTVGTGTIATAIIGGAIAGDLIWQCGFDTTNATGWASPITSIASGPGFTLLSVDVMLGTFSQYAIQGGSNVTPTASVSGGTDAFNTVSIALRSGAQGQAMPPGMRVVHVQHVDYNRNVACQFPSTGNLVYVTTAFGNGLGNLSFPAGWTLIPNVNEQGGWSTTTSPNLSFLVSGAATGSMGMCSIVMYDIAGAAAAPFDSWNHVSNGNENITTNGATWSFGTITPTTSNGLIIWTLAIGDGQMYQGNDPTYICNTVTYGNIISYDLMDNVDGYIHKYGTQAGTAYTCKFAVIENGFTLPVTAEYFGVMSVAFKAASITVVVPTVTASAATAVGSGIATLNGAISSNGGGVISADGFDYGTSIAYGTHVAAGTVQSGNFSFNLSGLTNGTTYHYRATAVNSAGTGVSADQQFTPSPPPNYALVNNTYVDPASVTGTTQTVVLAWTQVAGDILIVAVGYNSAIATAVVSDSVNGAYSIAIGPTTEATNGLSQYVFFRSNINGAASGSNTITVTFSASNIAFPDIRVSEFSSILGSTWTVNKSAGLAAATGTTDTSGPMATTTTANVLVYGAGYTTQTLGVGAGFTLIDASLPDSNIHEYKIVTSTGSYSATGSDAAGGTVVMQAVDFVSFFAGREVAIGRAFSSATVTAHTTGFAAGVPGLAQHVATGMERNPMGTFSITLPNPVGAGNGIIFGCQYNSSGGSSVGPISDNLGNTWVPGPSGSNASFANVNTFYCFNTTAGITTITLSTSGMSGVGYYSAFQAVVSEFFNVVAFDRQSASTISASPPSITPTLSGDLIWHWAFDATKTKTTVTGGAYNSITPIIAGSGFTLLHSDLQTGSVAQFIVQPVAAPIAPAFTKPDSDTWESVAIAFTSGLKGSAPNGIYIAHVQHTLLASAASQGRPAPIAIQFPAQGNLLVGLYDSGDVTINSVSDSGGNTWHVASTNMGADGGEPTQIVYGQGGTISNTLHSITAALSGTVTTDCMFVLYDVVNASAAAFDFATNTSGNQSSPGTTLTTSTLTPRTANGITFSTDSQVAQSMTGCVGGSYIFDSAVNSLNFNDTADGGTQTSTLDEDNGKAHIFNASLSPVTFVYTYNSTSFPIRSWGSVAVHFTSGVGLNILRPFPNNIPSSSPAFVQGNTFNVGGSFVSVHSFSGAFGSNNAAGNSILVFVFSEGPTSPVLVSDSQGNVYTLVSSAISSVSFIASAYVATNISPGPNTITASSGTIITAWDMQIVEYGPSLFDNAAHNIGVSSNLSSGNIVAHNANETIVMYARSSTNTTLTPTGGFTTRVQDLTIWDGITADLIAPIANTYAGGFTSATSNSWWVVTVALMPASVPIASVGSSGSVSTRGFTHPGAKGTSLASVIVVEQTVATIRRTNALASAAGSELLSPNRVLRPDSLETAAGADGSAFVQLGNSLRPRTSTGSTGSVLINKRYLFYPFRSGATSGVGLVNVELFSRPGAICSALGTATRLTRFLDNPGASGKSTASVRANAETNPTIRIVQAIASSNGSVVFHPKTVLRNPVVTGSAATVIGAAKLTLLPTAKSSSTGVGACQNGRSTYPTATGLVLVSVRVLTEIIHPLTRPQAISSSQTIGSAFPEILEIRIPTLASSSGLDIIHPKTVLRNQVALGSSGIGFISQKVAVLPKAMVSAASGVSLAIRVASHPTGMASGATLGKATIQTSASTSRPGAMASSQGLVLISSRILEIRIPTPASSNGSSVSHPKTILRNQVISGSSETVLIAQKLKVLPTAISSAQTVVLSASRCFSYPKAMASAVSLGKELSAIPPTFTRPQAISGSVASVAVLTRKVVGSQRSVTSSSSVLISPQFRTAQRPRALASSKCSALLLSSQRLRPNVISKSRTVSQAINEFGGKAIHKKKIESGVAAALIGGDAVVRKNQGFTPNTIQELESPEKASSKSPIGVQPLGVEHLKKSK